MSVFWSLEALLVLCSFGVLVVPGDKRTPCSDDEVIRLETVVRSITSCSVEVEGRVQVCEDSLWRNLCDSVWTLQDAQVACKSLGYSDEGIIIQNC